MNIIRPMLSLLLHDERGGLRTAGLFLVVACAFIAAAGAFSFSVTEALDHVTRQLRV